MLTKRTPIVLLVGINLLLLAAILFQSYSLPRAFAQARGRAGDFVCVTAKIVGQDYDALYVLDVPEQKLYAFYPTSGRGNKLAATPGRDLAKDFALDASAP